MKIMKRNNLFKMTALAATMMIASMVQIKAATTNLVQNIDFSLTFYEQGNTNQVMRGGVVQKTIVAVNKVRVTTRDVIAALGAATTNSFSAKAQLVYVRDANSLSNVAVVQVRDGTNVVDVSGYLARTNGDISVHGSVLDNLNGRLTGTTYSLQQFVVADAAVTESGLTNLLGIIPPDSNLAMTLNLNGFATTTYSSITHNGTTLVIDEVSADVSGTGVDVNGTPALVQGTVDILGRGIKVE
jgi:hypothetical protein